MVAPLAEYPFRSHWFIHEGLRQHYLDEGDPDAPAVVLLHGNPTWSFYYRKLVAPLAAHHRVIVPDHMGCGYSDKPESYSYTLARHRDNLSALLEHLGISQASLVLHDWGGVIGMAYATRYPERIQRLVVLNTAAFVLPRIPMRIQICRYPVVGPLLVRGLNAFLWLSFLFATRQWRRFDRQVRQGYLAPYDDWNHRVAIQRFVEDIPLEADHPTRPLLAEIEANLPGLAEHPMLILWGAGDFCFTARYFLTRWRELFPRAQVELLAGAGHYVVEDAWERLLPLMIPFLGEETDGRAAL